MGVFYHHNTNLMGNVLTECVQKLPTLFCGTLLDKTTTMEIVLGVADCLEESEWAHIEDLKPVTDAGMPHASKVEPDLQPLEPKSQPDVLGKQCRLQTVHSAGLQPMRQMLPASQPQLGLRAVEQPMQFLCSPPTHSPVARATSDVGGRFPTLPNTVPCMSGVVRLAPEIVFELLKCHQCVLVDTRGDDRSSGCIEGAVHVPAISTVPFTKRVPEMKDMFGDKTVVIFHCQYSCHRAPTCANMFRRLAHPYQQVAVLDGGFRGWESAGLPVLKGSGVKQVCDAHALWQGGQIIRFSEVHKHSPWPA